MKSIPFADALAAGKVKLSGFYEIAYNAADAPGHERGRTKTKKVALIYSVRGIEDGMALCRSRNGVTYQEYDERIPVANLEAYIPA